MTKTSSKDQDLTNIKILVLKEFSLYPSAMKKILLAWIGRTDLKSAANKGNNGLGPIANALDARTFDHACFLNNYPAEEVTPYIDWLKSRTSAPLTVHNITLASPTNFGEIYEAAAACVDQNIAKHGSDVELTFHLSPGTPAMAAVWILLAKTRYAAQLIESSVEEGVKTANVPFDISADYIPSLLQKSDERLQRLSAGLPPAAPEFDQIIHCQPALKNDPPLGHFSMPINKLSAL